MALIKWRDEFSVGVDAMDAEHKTIVRMINELNESMKNRSSDQEMGRIFRNLISYTQTHFASEERYMESIGYPGLESQRSEHAGLVRELAQLAREFKAGKLVIGKKLMGFLKDWLTNHILESDMKYAAFAKQKVGN